MSYTIDEGISIPPKQRSLKHKRDTDVIKTVIDIRTANPSISWMAAIHDILEETLTEDQMIDVEAHYRRIYDRIKLSYPDAE